MRFVLVPLVLCAAMFALGQETRPREEPKPSYYRIEISMRDVSNPAGKAVKRFVMHSDNPGRAVMRSGARFPVATGGAPGQFQYLDGGVNIECRLREAGGTAVLSGDFELTLVAEPADQRPPTTTNLRTSVTAPVTAGKPMVLAVIEDPATLKKFEIEATVTQLK